MPQATQLDALTFDVASQLAHPHKVGVSGPSQFNTAPGASPQVPFTVENLGTEDDTYDLAIQSLEGWGDAASFPAAIAVPAGQSAEVLVTVNIPADAELDDFDELTLIATSQGNPGFLDVATTTIALAAADQPPTVEITSPTDGAQVVEGATVTVTMVAQDDGGVTRVDLLVGGVVVASDTTAPFAGQFVAPSAGEQVVLTAVAVDTLGQTTTSAAVNLTAAKAESDVKARVRSGRLRIKGDDFANQLLVEQLSRSAILVTPQGGTRINGSNAPQQFRGVSRGLYVNLKGGDDRLTLDGVENRRRTVLRLGNGDDQVRLVNAVFGRLAVYLGEGDDELSLENDYAFRPDRPFARNIWTFFGGAGFDSLDAGLLSDPNGNANDNHLPRRTRWRQFEQFLS